MDGNQTRERRKKKTVYEHPPPPPPASQQQQQPMKVVYISNPMKLNASASNFRSLVQELTGQNSVWPADPSKYTSEYNNSISGADAAADVYASNSNNTDSGIMEMEILGKDNNGGGGAAEPSAGSSDPYSQPLDQGACEDDDDRVVLIDHHTLQYMLDDHQYFASFNPGSSRKN